MILQCGSLSRKWFL